MVGHLETESVTAKVIQVQKFKHYIVYIGKNLQVSFGTQMSVCHFHHLPDLQIHRFIILFPTLVVKEHQTEPLEEAQTMFQSGCRTIAHIG